MASILDRRASGVLLHPTSLPGPYGIGDLGAEAHAFIDTLAGQDLPKPCADPFADMADDIPWEA